MPKSFSVINGTQKAGAENSLAIDDGEAHKARKL
jgi:hypothetical protein